MKLLPLRCPHCEQPLAPGDNDLIMLCDACHTPVHIGDEGLSQAEITFAAPRPETAVTRWQPFWLFEGQVDLLNRDTQGGWGGQSDDARELWGQPRRFYVPAWEISLREAQEIGCRLVQDQPVYQAVAAPADPKLTPVVIAAEDAAKLIEFIILAVETRRSDWLKKLEFTLALGSPQLWALPATENDLAVLDVGR